MFKFRSLMKASQHGPRSAHTPLERRGEYRGFARGWWFPRRAQSGLELRLELLDAEPVSVQQGVASPESLPWPTWDATEHQEVHQDVTPTQVIPTIREAPRILQRGSVAVSRIGLAMNDVEASTKSATTLLDGNLEAALAGLFEYVERHPVAA